MDWKLQVVMLTIITMVLIMHIHFKFEKMKKKEIKREFQRKLKKMNT